MLQDPEMKGYDSYILSQFAQFIKAQGARVVPILHNEPEEVIRDKVSKLNGIFFPGGSGDYLKVGK